MVKAAPVDHIDRFYILLENKTYQEHKKMAKRRNLFVVDVPRY